MNFFLLFSLGGEKPVDVLGKTKLQNNLYGRGRDNPLKSYKSPILKNHGE